MTLMQLERYILSGVENLHIKIDSALDNITDQLKEMRAHMELRFDRVEVRLDNHEARLERLEKSNQ